MKKLLLTRIVPGALVAVALSGFTFDLFANTKASVSASPVQSSETVILAQQDNGQKVSKFRQALRNKLHCVLGDSTHLSQFQYVEAKTKELNLPKELALIPVIESEYKNTAVSPKGAGGVWQLMPQTAKDFGITTKARFDISTSTVAALKYLKELHDKFGNWDLTVAAYNAGEGRVQKALKKNPNAVTVADLKLPKETQNYVLAYNQLQDELRSYNV